MVYVCMYSRYIFNVFKLTNVFLFFKYKLIDSLIDKISKQISYHNLFAVYNLIGFDGGDIWDAFEIKYKFR